MSTNNRNTNNQQQITTYTNVVYKSKSRNRSKNNVNNSLNKHNFTYNKNIEENTNAIQQEEEYEIDFYGWRKNCLYMLILSLMILIIINLALTLWILNVMEFSAEGMGQLQIIAGGLQLSGQALILDLLRASTIRSKHGQHIVIESSRNFTINSIDQANDDDNNVNDRTAADSNLNGNIENKIFLGHDKLECLTKNFRITDTHGTNLFSVDRKEIAIGSNSLKIDGEGGIILNESIHTPLVRADVGKEMILESSMKSLEMKAIQEIFIQSKAGGLFGNTLDNIKLHSVAGNICLDSQNIQIPNLKIALPSSSSSSSSTLSLSLSSFVSSSKYSAAASTTTTTHNVKYHKVYQLCACASGKIFLASPHTICTVDDINLCR